MVESVKYIKSYDGEILYAEARRNSKKIKYNFVILHGLGGDANSTLLLTNNILKNIPDSQCITYDLRGHGFSSNVFPSSAETIEDNGAKDLKSVCDYFLIKKPIIICHSIGGIFIQRYLEKEIKPEPLYTFLFCSPLTTYPFSISRHVWFYSYKKISKFLRNKKRRSLEEHLKYKNSVDIDIYRILNDVKYTGLVNLTFNYLSLFGWKNKSLKSIDKENVFFVCGINDTILPQKKQLKLLNNLNKIKIKSFNSNHHQIYINNYLKITNLIKRIVINNGMPS